MKKNSLMDSDSLTFIDFDGLLGGVYDSNEAEAFIEVRGDAPGCYYEKLTEKLS